MGKKVAKESLARLRDGYADGEKRRTISWKRISLSPRPSPTIFT